MTTPHHATARLRTELWHPDEVSAEAPPSPGWVEHAVMSRGSTFALLPMRPRSAAAASLLRWTDAESAKTAATRLAGWAGLRTGLAQPALRTRTWVAAGRPGSLHHYLATQLTLPHVHASGTFGPPRPNQKPVLRIFDPWGATVAFVKIGWNDLTTQLVRHEAAFLDRAPRPAGAKIALPRLLDLGEWTDRTVAISSAMLGSFHLLPPAPPSVAVLHEVAALGETYVAALGSSRYRERLAAADASAGVRQALARIDERWSMIRVPFGRWHGDWTPWNMSTTGEALVVWDWERTATDTPVGFDALHFEFQRRLTTSDGTPLEDFVAAVAAVSPTLRALGVPDEGIPAAACLYVVEMMQRFAGGASSPESRVPWLNGLLSDALRHFAGV